MKLSPLSLAVKLLCVCLLASFTVIGQSDNSQLSGFVKDQTGGVIPGAKVVVKSESRQFERTTVTNVDGYYTIPNLPSGEYSISVEMKGFKAFKTTGKKLDPSIPGKLDVSMDPGDITEVVTVTAAQTTVQAETATVGKLIEGKQIELMQLNGRNPIFLAALKPGVSSGDGLSRFGFGLGTGGFNINGSRNQDNLITFDGAVGTRTRSNGESIGTADLDSTQEVQILTANYNAEYGRSAGGQIRIVTKSGTQSFHGGVYEYFRNSALNANDWSRNRLGTPSQSCDDPRYEKAQFCRPNPFRFNQFGYNFNGPVVIPGTNFNKDRSKLFFLWGQEWVKERKSVNSTRKVPSLKMRQGDFSELLLSKNLLGNDPVYLKDPLKAGDCKAGSTTGCYSDGGVINKIPVGRLSQQGLALLSAFPTPNTLLSNNDNYSVEAGAFTNQRKDTVSIDYLPNEKHSLKYRLSMFRFYEDNGLYENFDLMSRIFERPNQTTSLNWTWSLSPTLISEVMVAGSRDQVTIGLNGSKNKYQRSNYGITYPYLFKEKLIQDKIPTIAINNFSTLDGSPYPAKSSGPIYQLANNWTNIRGNHTLKTGFYFERAGQNDFDQINVSGTPGGTNNQNGRFEFVNTTISEVIAGKKVDFTTPAIVNSVLGDFKTYAEIGERSYTPYRGHMYEWYLQDSWKATQKLRIELGLRHTIVQPYYSLWGNMAVFDPKYYDGSKAVTLDGLGNIKSGTLQQRYNGVVIPGDGWPDAAKGRVGIADSGQYDFLFRGEPKQYSRIHWKDTFQPRLGIAYALNDKTAIRAGVGRFMTRLGVSDSIFLGGNTPIQPTVSISTNNIENLKNMSAGSGTVFPVFIMTQDKNFKMPEAWSFNAMVEREIGFNTIVEFGYVGRRGLHGQRERNINQAPVGSEAAAKAIRDADPKKDTPEGNPAGHINYYRPYKGFSIIRVTENVADSWYHGLQIGVNRRYSNGLMFGAAYTLSKSLDDGSDKRDILPDAFDASPLWGASDYDRRHVLVLNGAWLLPMFKDKATFMGKVLGGWTLTAVSQFQTGTPVNIKIGSSRDNAGIGTGSGEQWAKVNGEIKIDGKYGTDGNWFDPSVFTASYTGLNTQRVRNIVYRPGLQSHNLGLMKDFQITERQRVTFRFEAFNWLNHPNWNAPGTNINDTNTFGKITGKGDFAPARQLQFALRYGF